jgi:hypothetical protein
MFKAVIYQESAALKMFKSFFCAGNSNSYYQKAMEPKEDLLKIDMLV